MALGGIAAALSFASPTSLARPCSAAPKRSRGPRAQNAETRARDGTKGPGARLSSATQAQLFPSQLPIFASSNHPSSIAAMNPLISTSYPATVTPHSYPHVSFAPGTHFVFREGECLDPWVASDDDVDHKFCSNSVFARRANSSSTTPTRFCSTLSAFLAPPNARTRHPTGSTTTKNTTGSLTSFVCSTTR